MAPPTFTVSPDPHTASDTLTLTTTGGQFSSTQGSGTVFVVDDDAAVFTMDVVSWSSSAVQVEYPTGYDHFSNFTAKFYVINDGETEAGMATSVYIGVPPASQELAAGDPVLVATVSKEQRAEAQSSGRGYITATSQGIYEIQLLLPTGTFDQPVALSDVDVVPMGRGVEDYLIKQNRLPPYDPPPPPPPLAASTTNLVSSQNPSTSGASVTFTATVTGGAGTPTGNVAFLVDNVVVQTVALNGSGVAAYSTSALAVGGRAIRANYLGSLTYATSFDTLTQTVNAPAQNTTTVATTNPNPSNFGSSVTVSATVTPAVSGTPTGDVNFFIDNVAYGSNPVALSGGVASFNTTSLAVGGRVIRAEYQGSIAYNSSISANHNHTVNAVNQNTTTAVTTQNNPSNIGEQFNVTATVTAGAGTPTGNVNFTIGGTPYGGNPVALSGGSATIQHTGGSGGTIGIVADYLGGTGYNASTSPTHNHSVRFATSTSVSSTPQPSDDQVGYTVNISVSSVGGTPTGSVNAFINGNPYGNNPLTLSGGATSFNIPANDPLTNAGTATNYTATYFGSSQFTGSSSGTHQHTVRPYAGVQGSANPTGEATPGHNVTFTASFTTNGATPTGTVDFYDLTTNTVLGTVALSGGTAQLIDNTLTPGLHTIHVDYSGDSNYSPERSPPLFYEIGSVETFTVQTINTFGGGSLNVVVNVTSNSGTPTGNVELVIDGVSQGVQALSGGTFTYSGIQVPPGPHDFRTDFLGSANYDASFDEDLQVNIP